MKGKGKGDRREDIRDCPLNFPDITPVDHAKECLQYTSVLERDPEESIGIEELDPLQTELEIMLAAVAKRMRQLESEISLINTWQDKSKDKKGSLGKVPDIPTPSASPSGKRSGKGAEEKPSKRYKDSSGKATAPPSTSKPKGKGQQKPPEPEPAEVPKIAPAATAPAPPAPIPPENPNQRVIKNDAPNRFWSMVEPYCREVTTEDMKFLEEVMRTHEDEAEYYKTPSLGKHYSQKWAHEDMLDEQRESGKVNKKSGVINNNSKSNNANEASALLKKLEERDEDQSPFGPLTQRLVQALIEENVMAPLEDTPITEAEAVEAATISPRSLAKQLNLGNAAALERRIKRELEEQGIFEVEDRPEDNPDDEILNELRKKQQELKAISQHNLMVAKRLYKHAKEEINRQELRKKMAVADAEVMEAFRKIQAAKQKKKTPTKKERDSAMKALKERETLVKQLESMDI